MKRLNVDPWAEDVERVLCELPLSGFRTDQVMRAMQMTMRDKDAISEKRIKKILQQIGFQSSVRWNSDKQRSEREWLR